MLKSPKIFNFHVRNLVFLDTSGKMWIFKSTFLNFRTKNEFLPYCVFPRKTARIKVFPPLLLLLYNVLMHNKRFGPSLQYSPLLSKKNEKTFPNPSATNSTTLNYLKTPKPKKPGVKNPFSLRSRLALYSTRIPSLTQTFSLPS